jgi:hypothetical protein
MAGEVVQSTPVKEDQSYYHMNGIASPQSCSNLNEKYRNLQKILDKLNASYASSAKRYAMSTRINGDLLALNLIKDFAKGFLDLAGAILSGRGEEKAAAVATRGSSAIDLFGALAMKEAGLIDSKQAVAQVGGAVAGMLPGKTAAQTAGSAGIKYYASGMEQDWMRQAGKKKAARKAAIDRMTGAAADSAGAMQQWAKATGSPHADGLGKSLALFKIIMASEKFRKALDSSLDTHHQNRKETRAAFIRAERAYKEGIAALTKELNRLNALMDTCVSESKPRRAT